MRKLLLAGTYLCGTGCALWIAMAPTKAQDGIPPKVRKELVKLDQNKDGKIQRGEVPKEVTSAAFARGDKDKDGVLTFKEAYRVYLFTHAAIAASKKGDEVRKKVRKLDKNADGYVTRDEFPADDRLFEKLDRDGDKKIDYDEALSFFIEEEIGKVFEKHDADMSGTLTKDELPDEKARAIFFAADVDEDGEATGKEVFDFIYAVRKRANQVAKQPGLSSPSASGKGAPKLDPGKTGAIGVALNRFANLDGDQSGKLSRDELGASKALFQQLDVDRDEQVSRAELLLRLRRAKELGERGKRLKGLVEKHGLQEKLVVLGAEVKGLFLAGRYDEASRLMDQLELDLLEREQK